MAVASLDLDYLLRKKGTACVLHATSTTRHKNVQSNNHQVKCLKVKEIA